MKTLNGPLQKRTQLLTIFTLLLIAIPNLSFGQKNKVELTPSCIEYVGDGSGRISVSWGFENTSSKTVVVEESNSVVTYNHGQSKKYGISTFPPGKHEKVLTQIIDADDRVVWKVVLPNGEEKTVSADINSNHCRGIALISPYYTPPPGGKLKGSLIGTELNSLYERSVSEKNNFHPASDDIFQIDEYFNVYIEVVSKIGASANLANELNDLVPGLSATEGDFLNNRAVYWFPIDQLIDLNDFLYLNYARPVFTEIPKVIWNQGDQSMRSEYTRLGFEIGEFGLDGKDVRVGVISNSYNTKGNAGLDVEYGHLPEGVKILDGDIITPPGFSLSDEGRAMMQIVHDVAPGAELVFRTGYRGELDMAKGIRDLADPENPNGNCDIIVDDITYITEPFFRDGIIAQAIDAVAIEANAVDRVSYFSSAGNFGSSSCQGLFKAGSPVSDVIGLPHNFSTVEGEEDVYQEIKLDSGTYTLVLQWDDGSDLTETDLDIYLTTNTGNTKLGYNRQNLGGAAVEVLPFKVSENDVYTNILIARAAGDSPVIFKYVVFRGGQGFDIREYGQGTSTIVGHANAEGTMAVGAVGYYQEQKDETSVQAYSSTGGTPIITNNVNGPYTEWLKPDFTAPDGVNTSVNLSEGNIFDPDEDGAPNFFGTSAAAPHAAGAAALIIQARKKFDNGNLSTPDAIRDLLRSTATGNVVDDNGNNVHNDVSGFGFIQPYAAIKTFANPKPEVLGLEVIQNTTQSENIIPGESADPIQFRIKGNFFVDNDDHPKIRKSKVFFRGVELENEVIDNPDGTQDITSVEIENDQTIIVTHPGFLGNPEIKVENPPIANGPLIDGGVSNSIFFSTTVKQLITIKAESFSKKYGEALPDFSSVIFMSDNPTENYNATIEYGDPLFDGLTPEEKKRIREHYLSFKVNATATSNVYHGYTIDLVLKVPDQMIEVDYAIAEKYDIEIEDGNLSIEKLNLKITPLPVTIGYGQVLTQDDIKFKYESDDLTAEELTAISGALNVQYTNPLPVGIPMVNGISLVRGTALVNVPEEGEFRVEIDDDETIYLGEERVVYNGQALPRGVALVNGHPFVQIDEILSGEGLFNGEEITFWRDGGISYITAIGDDQLADPIAVENGIALVRGTALVNGVKVELKEDGTILINGQPTVIGTALVNGVVFVRGTALVNSEHIVRGIALVNQFPRGTALVNEIQIPVINGIPDVDGNEEFSLGPIAMVNGIPMVRGTALVNGLSVEVDEFGGIDVSGEIEDYSFVNGLAYVRGTALVNGSSRVLGTALVNGGNLVRGIALVNDAPADDILDNMNFLASTNSLSYLDFVNGTALVNDMSGIDGISLALAAVVPPDDGNEVNYISSEETGIALVNGHAFVRGTALVNEIALVRGTALVNENTISAETNGGAIAINHEADTASSFIPVTFITGTDATKPDQLHKIIPGTFLSNNFNITYGLGTLEILPAQLSITAADNQSKTYGVEPDPTLLIGSYKLDDGPIVTDFDGTVEKVKLYDSDALSGELTRSGSGTLAGRNVGSYLITGEGLSAGDNYIITFPGDDVYFKITEAPLHITADPVSKIYGEVIDPPLTFTLEEGDLQYEDDVADAVSGSLYRIAGKDVFDGGYQILGENLISGSNYNIESYESAIFMIHPSTLLITPEINGRNIDGVDPETLTIASYELDGEANSPEFDGSVAGVELYWGDVLTGSLACEIGEEVGSYPIERGDLAVNGIFDNRNYLLNVVDSWFYINPYGPSTRAVKPVLNCVEVINATTDHFVANFEYKNDNDFAVFVPLGEDNLLEGDVISISVTDMNGTTTLDHQPTLFEKGGGSFQVEFYGDLLRWTVSSLDQDHKASNAATANSSSTKCNDNLKSAGVSTAMDEEDLPGMEDLMVYPNPVSNKVNLVMKDIQHYKMIMLLDMTGRAHRINSIKTRSDRLEIDMTQMASGPYFIKLVMEDSIKVVPLIKK